MILAYLLLLTGLTLSAVAIYYSVVGLTAIFSAAVIPIIVMGASLEVAKLVCASWIKANWERVPILMKAYMCIAVTVLMLITSMGIFGFLSKAHNDQNLVSGDVQSKIAIYDEKIRTAKDNIDANRKALKQMDEAVDQVMGRSSDEKGAERAVGIRRSQQKERARLQSEIAAEQKIVAAVSEERAPIAAEVRKVEAEVGPIKYIAKLLYGDHGADENMLEQAVTWIIILIVVVFDPLAVIMLLAAQMSFVWAKEEKEKPQIDDHADDLAPAMDLPQATGTDNPIDPPSYEADNGPLTDEQIAQIEEHLSEPTDQIITVDDADLTVDSQSVEPTVPLTEESELDKWNKMIEEAERHLIVEQTTVEERVAKGETYIDGEGQEVTADEVTIDEPVYAEEDGSKKKTYMIKDTAGQIQVRTRD
jgi:hypothetical protein